MKDTLDLKGILIPVGRELRAKPGDRLIVVAGICLGVYTGDAGIPIAPTGHTTAPVSDKPVHIPDAPAKTRKPYGRPRALGNISGTTVHGQPIKSVLPVVEAMREYFKTHDTATATELRAVFKKESDGKPWRVRDACAYLLAKGEIEATGMSSSRRYHSLHRSAA